MHGQHITITANNANNKIENVYRAARLGFFQKKTVSSRTAKQTGRNLVGSSFFQKKLERGNLSTAHDDPVQCKTVLALPIAYVYQDQNCI